MKLYSSNIISDIEALRVKQSEREFYKHLKNRLSGIGITKITPFENFYADLYYEENGQVLFIKFMDTQEETFSILEEELVEIMEEEYDYFVSKINKLYKSVYVNYIYIMPYVDLSSYQDEFVKNDFVKNHIIDSKEFFLIKKDSTRLSGYYSKKNDEIQSNLLRYNIAKEYHVIKKEDEKRILNTDFKKIVFDYKSHEYQATFLTDKQITGVNSIRYGNSLFIGQSGSGKTTTLIARIIKLSRIYDKDKFLFLAFNKQLVQNIKSIMDMMNLSLSNVEIINFHGYILNLAKNYGLKIDKNNQKSFDEQFETIFTKTSQIYKNQHIYKGIIIDEAENFNENHINFLRNLLYKTKYFFMISSDKAKDIRGFMKDFTGGWENLEYVEIAEFNKNYRCTKNISEFTNNFIDNIAKYVDEKNLILPEDYYIKSTSPRHKGQTVSIIKCDTVEDKLKNITKLISRLIDKGIKYSDICIIYPFNKRKTKNKTVIYFQYLLKMALEEANIGFMIANEDFTNLTYKSGVSISNIFSANNLEYKIVILCELEMLYTHSLGSEYSYADVSTFIKSLNMVYTAITRATEELYVFTLMEDSDSDILGFLKIS